MKKSIIDINVNLLEEYSEFERVNENWNILSYINYRYDANTAIAMSKLYFPDFIVIEGCTILSFLYDPSTFKQWHNELNGKTSEIEKICNSYELKDFFHINSADDEDSIITELGKCLTKSWSINVKMLFPQGKFNVEVFNEYNSRFITMYSV